MDRKSVALKEEDELQCTIGSIIYLKGIGLHSGKDTSIIIEPAYADTGITFIRKDLNPSVVIKAECGNICSTNLRTSIGKDGVCISTVEHLMSALWGAGIDNAVIEVYGEEIPALDGSALVFYEAIQESGIKELGAKRKYIEILEPILANNQTGEDVLDYFIAVYPSNDFEILYTMDFNHPYLGSGVFEEKIDSFNFYKEISMARTFGFLKEVDLLKKNGLALGGSLDNALVLNDAGILNKEGLRYKDEFIRHKVLDLIGDLYLSGYRIKGKVIAKKTGHGMNAMLVKNITGFLKKNRLKANSFKETKQPVNFLKSTHSVNYA
jgi:UDP-3-O-[3-hydroxymyristoyl] N-acetylglucosamine deacetylase